jgi:hypothetical protein
MILQLRCYAVPAIQSQVPFFYSSRQQHGPCSGCRAADGADGDAFAGYAAAGAAGPAAGDHDDGWTCTVSRGRLDRSLADAYDHPTCALVQNNDHPYGTIVLFYHGLHHGLGDGSRLGCDRDRDCDSVLSCHRGGLGDDGRHDDRRPLDADGSYYR